ncbi:MAG: hypothetical protein ACLVEJ_12415 [Parabacteroides sp.]
MGGDGMERILQHLCYFETIGLRGVHAENGSIAGNAGYSSYGHAYSRLAMELRYPFLLEPSSTIYGLVFAEAGNAWKDLKSFNPFDLKRSVGVGARIFLPMIGLMVSTWRADLISSKWKEEAGIPVIFIIRTGILIIIRKRRMKSIIHMAICMYRANRTISGSQRINVNRKREGLSLSGRNTKKQLSLFQPV